MQHTTMVTPEPGSEAVAFGGGAYWLSCTCGETVVYSGLNFTLVEAQRHERWHAQQVA